MMTTWRARCPDRACESYEVEPIAETVRLYDETVPLTHRCRRCGKPFRVTPPTEQCLQAYRHPEVTAC